MAAGPVLVDTSAWVEFLNRPGSAHHAAVAQLLDLDRVAITGVVAAELLRGCRTPAEADELGEALAGVIRIEIDFQDWIDVGRDLLLLRQRGLSVSLSDASIAHAALEGSQGETEVRERFRLPFQSAYAPVVLQVKSAAARQRLPIVTIGRLELLRAQEHSFVPVNCSRRHERSPRVRRWSADFV